MFVKPIKDLVKKTPPKPKAGLDGVPTIPSLYPDTSPSPQEMLAECLSSAATSPPATSRGKHAALWHEQKKKQKRVEEGDIDSHSSVRFCLI